eukprot:3978500-Amphidinium_carterae.1
MSPVTVTSAFGEDAGICAFPECMEPAKLKNKWCAYHFRCVENMKHAASNVSAQQKQRSLETMLVPERAHASLQEYARENIGIAHGINTLGKGRHKMRFPNCFPSKNESGRCGNRGSMEDPRVALGGRSLLLP